jgi:hypothetical protein
MKSCEKGGGAQQQQRQENFLTFAKKKNLTSSLALALSLSLFLSLSLTYTRFQEVGASGIHLRAPLPFNFSRKELKIELILNQGDQMTLLKNRPISSPTHFCQN